MKNLKQFKQLSKNDKREYVWDCIESIMWGLLFVGIAAMVVVVFLDEFNLITI